MPPKKKGAKSKKGKGKGKGKGKKKGSKSEKGDKELMVKEALASTKIWEARYQAVEKSRHEYRENAKRLVVENEVLQNAVNQTERDTVEVIAYLKKEDGQKDEEIDALRQQVKDIQVKGLNERDALIAEHKEKVSQLEGSLSEKNEEVQVMQGELKTVREFRKRRSEMQQQLEQLQSSLEASAYDHKTSLSNMEHRFFEEKLRLQKEANRRIAELAEKAHAEAVSNLDSKTREVYRENLRMAEALSLHMENEEILKKSKGQLEMSNRQLVAEKELNQQLVQEKVAQARQHKKLIKELQEKVQSLEQSLTVVIREFEHEKHLLQEGYAERLAASSSELVTLRRRCELQEREMNHVKRLARKILGERSEVEQFFLEALAHVKKEIATNRAEYRRDAQMVYQKRMLDATMGRGRFPLIRTFRPGQETSTNSVYHDMDQAERWEGIGSRAGGVDISDLTWEQKEQCLRLLFAKMNRRTNTSSAKPLQGQTPPQALPAPPTQPHHAESAHPAPPTHHQSSTNPVFMTEQLRGEGEVGEHVRTAVEQVT